MGTLDTDDGVIFRKGSGYSLNANPGVGYSSYMGVKECKKEMCGLRCCENQYRSIVKIPLNFANFLVNFANFFLMTLGRRHHCRGKKLGGEEEEERQHNSLNYLELAEMRPYANTK